MLGFYRKNKFPVLFALILLNSIIAYKSNLSLSDANLAALYSLCLCMLYLLLLYKSLLKPQAAPSRTILT